jgi:hypothetical protein
MKVCPKCGREFDRLLAVSRVDNRTMICDTCGNMEALEAMKCRQENDQSWNWRRNEISDFRANGIV